MQKLLHTLSDSSSTIQMILFAFSFFISWNIENLYGISYKYKKWKHAFVNARFIFTNMPLIFFLGAAFVFTIKWTGYHHFGILYQLPFRHYRFIYFCSAFVFMDFGEYIYHILMHKIKRLWLFHVVHHSDGIVDVSTVLREHPGENIIRNSFTLLMVLLSGIGAWALLLRQIIQTASNVFAHINYRLPLKLNNIVSYVFVTPNVHQVHHHYKRPYTDCNYGDVLTIWDRCFGTFGKLPAEEIMYGVDTHMHLCRNSSYKSLMQVPFSKIQK